MNIPPINPTASFQEPLEQMAVKNLPETTPSSEPSLFRAWTRGTDQVLAGATVASNIHTLQSSEAFWNQWPGKKWLAS